VQLHYREYGRRAPDRPGIVLLHGLFGSATNWHSIARRLEGRFHLLVPDLRNHGRSPHLPVMDYPVMAGDVMDLLERLRLEQVLVVGHSMGGKVAMWLALEQPERVHGLVPVDIAPVRYSHDFDTILGALESLDLTSLKDRTEADRLLAATLESPGLRAYLLQNLVKGTRGWAWRVNLAALRHDMQALQAFPATPRGRQFTGNTLFIHGGRSDYLGAPQAAAARRLFPHARMRVIPEAGHWVYSEAPAAFLAALEQALPV
jgi:esterase